MTFRFFGTRLASLVALLLVLSVVLFVLQEISATDAAAATLGPTASPEAIAAERARLGLDGPPVDRYLDYLGGLFTGDLGTSFRTRRPVTEDIGSYLPATLELVLFAFLLALLLALLFALSSTLRWRGAGALRGLLFVSSTAPTFLLGIFFLIVFYQQLDWLPANGRASGGAATDGPTGLLVLDGLLAGDPAASVDALRHLLLPALALAVGPALAIGRVFRSSLRTTLDAEYVRTARAKGLGERAIVVRHVARNSVNAALSMTGLQIGFMFAGVLVVESVFSWPGLGSYLGASIPVSDFPAVAGVTFVLGAVYIVANTAADVLQGVADPRVAV
ncbi:ABC transporter permease subunit [Streptomyces sp. 3MP-14]|uniref:ABC transporter permease subunit n=1 Tax=Streptomyces mimosae TaxID=2586635 RepID=A0A5N6A1U9_9ACTN|nr:MULTISPECIES: ABC transporter permease [Streptomyces]KAB8162222.1 ABC transporter permease subunit [Streptomyces mimosae]KAB8173879.1 ABC transporter permease subunit [Streptomyces sp. 3MP-14]